MKFSERLKKQKDFDLVFRKGKRLYSKNLTFLYFESSQLKIGISLGKKHGKAVIRNRVKRIIRAAFQSYLKEISKPCFIVVLPTVSETYDFFEIKKDLGFLLKKSGIIND